MLQSHEQGILRPFSDIQHALYAPFEGGADVRQATREQVVQGEDCARLIREALERRCVEPAEILHEKELPAEGPFPSSSYAT